MKLSLLSLTAALAAAAWSQDGPFLQVATTDDAGQIYVWSTQKLRTEPALSGWMALYQLSASSITQMFTAATPSNYMGYLNLHVSGGGQTLIWTEVTRCFGGSSCIGFQPSAQSRLFRAGMPEPWRMAGHVQISRSGRYLVEFGATSSTLRDGESGGSWIAPISRIAAGQAVTSTGAVLGLSLFRQNRLVLWRPGQEDTLADLISTPTEATVSDNGEVVVYGSTDGTLTAIDTRDPRRASYTLGPGSGASLSNDGRLVLFRRDRDCLLARRGSAEAVRLLPEGVQAAACTLSGFGLTAVAVTIRGQILKVHTSASRTVEEVIPETPFGSIGGSLAPGGVLTWRGASRVRLMLDASPLPLIRDMPGDLWFQVPFDLEVNAAEHRVEVETASPFAPARVMRAVARAPYFVNDSGGLVAAHEDFRGLLTNIDPATPGEVVHLWAVGLGAVSPPVSAAVPAPASPLSRLLSPFDCRFLHGSRETLEVLFAGLAPGMIGVYQVDVRLPADVPENMFFTCGTPGVETERHGGWLPVRRR